MATKQKKLLAMISLSSLLLLMGCNPAAESMDKQQAAAAQLTELDRGIRDLITSPIAQNVASCKIVTLNPINCQQAAKHLLYSTENTNEQMLLTLVEKYNQVVSTQISNEDLSCTISAKPAVMLNKDLCIPVELATK